MERAAGAALEKSSDPRVLPSIGGASTGDLAWIRASWPRSGVRAAPDVERAAGAPAGGSGCGSGGRGCEHGERMEGEQGGDGRGAGVRPQVAAGADLIRDGDGRGAGRGWKGSGGKD